METVVNLVIPNNRVAPRPYLDPRQRVAMDIVFLEYAPPTSKEVHAPLETAEYLVVTESRVALTGDPDAGIGVGKYLVLYELAPPLGMKPRQPINNYIISKSSRTAKVYSTNSKKNCSKIVNSIHTYHTYTSMLFNHYIIMTSLLNPPYRGRTRPQWSRGVWSSDR